MIILQKEIEIFSNLCSFQYIENLNKLSAKLDQAILDHLETVIVRNRNPYQTQVYKKLIIAWNLGLKSIVKEILAMRKSQNNFDHSNYKCYVKKLDEELNRIMLVKIENNSINSVLLKQYPNGKQVINSI